MPSRTNDSRANNSRTTSSRANTTARTEVLDQLKDDHKRVKKAYREFTKLDLDQDPGRCEALVRQVLAELSVHAALEEELLYPAARDAIAEPDLIDEAEVEHESAHALMVQLKSMDAQDEKFAARFTVLCEYVMHHVKEEESELFPQLENARIDWESLARQMSQRRAQLVSAATREEGAEGRVTETADLTEAAATPGSESATRGGARGKGAAAARQPRAGSDQGTAAQPGESMNSRRV